MRYIKKTITKSSIGGEKGSYKKIFSNRNTIKKIDKYVFELLEFNKHTNLVGKSTLKTYGKDTSQTPSTFFFIEKKIQKIFDLGTGEGFLEFPYQSLGIKMSLWLTLLEKNRFYKRYYQEAFSFCKNRKEKNRKP